MNMNSFIVNAVLVVLIVLSAVTWTIAVVKIRQFKKLQLQNSQFQDAFWNADSWQSGIEISKQFDCELAQIAKTGFKEFDECLSNPQALKYAGDIHDILARPMQQEAQKILRTQEKGMAELASIGSTAPFIGLFGTVWGIMNALKEISASGQASIDVVAGPIGEALIATAIGIAAALPAVIFYNYFLRKMKIWVTELEGFTESFLRLASKQKQSSD
jgi:biopolymer transport protein ExbB